MDLVIFAFIQVMRAHLPPVFLGSLIGELTGGACHWPTLQNRRSRREIPDDCFAYSGRQVLVRRDPFLDWWGSTLSTDRPVIGGSHTMPNKAVTSAGEHTTPKSKPRNRRSTTKLAEPSVGGTAPAADTSVECK